MLKNFNALIKNIITEAAENEDDEQRIKNVYHCNEFYNRFLWQLSLDDKVLLTRQRNNVFLVGGLFKDVIKFFNDLKVDKDFMDEPKDFEIYQPMYTFGDTQHNMNRDEQYPSSKGLTPNSITTHDDDNLVRRVIEGIWKEFNENVKKGTKLLKVQPNKLKKYIKEVQKEYDLTNDDQIFIEFTVNCEQWKNNIFDAEYKSEDDINDFGAASGDDKRNIDEDFDYSQCVMPKNNDDSHRAALKDIKKTEKTYKENKLK